MRRIQVMLFACLPVVAAAQTPVQWTTYDLVRSPLTATTPARAIKKEAAMANRYHSGVLEIIVRHNRIDSIDQTLVKK